MGRLARVTRALFCPPPMPTRALLLVALILRGASAHAGVLLPNPDGYWATPNLPTQVDHVAVVVPDRDLLVVIAAGTAPAGIVEVWATPLADGEAWIRLSAGGPALGPGFVAVYDSLSRRILVHGGQSMDARTWQLRLDPVVTWSEFIPEAESPGARWDHVAIYDPRHHRVILHGGRNAGGLLPDAWELRLHGARPSWSPLKARGLPPGARAGHAAVYDPPGLRMVLFGGGSIEHESEIWELSLRGHPAWNRRAIPSGPGAIRTQHSLVAEPTRARLLLHGGIDGSGVRLADTWELIGEDPPAWVQLAPGGFAPPPRSNHIAAFDAARARMIVSGGPPEPNFANSTWALDASDAPRWDRLGPTADLPGLGPSSPSPWMSATMDLLRGRLALLAKFPGDVIGQTWIRDFAPNPRWSRVFDPPMRNTDVVYEPAGDRLVFHGGFSPTLLGGYTNETWQLALGAGLGSGWRLVPTGGAGPPVRRIDHVLVLDSRRNRLAVFGGAAKPPGPASCVVTVDAALLSLGSTPAQWAPVTGGPAPDGGWFPVGVYDEAGDRLLVHGGLFACRFPAGHPSGAIADGTWALDMADPRGWTRLTPPQLGPGFVPDAAYDPIARRMVAAATGTLAWELPLDPGTETWRALSVGGSGPVISNPCSFDYDPARDRFVLVTSQGSVRFLLPSRGDEPLAIAHRARAGGESPPVPGLVQDASIGFAVATNPARGRVQFTVALRDDAPARLTLHDVRGRLLATREIAAGTRGPVTLEAPPGAPGIYFARLRQGAWTQVRKVSVVE